MQRISLTKKDRVLLINQYQILKHLDPKSADHYEELSDTCEAVIRSFTR